MTRWLALILIALIAAFADAAAVPVGPPVPAGPETRGTPEQLVPTQPWPLPASAASRPATTPSATGATGPLTRMPTASPVAQPAAGADGQPALVTRDMPAVSVVGRHWYEEEQRDPPLAEARLYLDRMLAGEVVEGWKWDAGYRVEEAAEGYEAPADESLYFGLEGRVAQTTAKSESGSYIEAVMLGPSMNWQPSQRTQLEFAPLVGVAAPYPMSEVFVAFSWKF